MSTPLCTKCGAPGPFYQGIQRHYWCTACECAYSRANYAVKKARRLARLHARAAAGLLLTRREQVILARATCPPGQKVCTYCCTAKTPGWFYPSPYTKDGRRQYCRQCCSELTALHAHQTKERRHAA